MDVVNYEIKDKQARFLIMKNFYQEVMSKLLKRFLMVLHFRATGDVLGENCDIMSKILPHLPKNHTLKKEYKYRTNLFEESKKRDLTHKQNLDVSKFDFSMSFACLTEIQGLPSWKNHQFCILCTSNCKNILLGNAEKKECNNCAFCTTSPNGSCYSKMLTMNLNIGRKTRNIGTHASQFPAENLNIQENISAITALYEYLHTNGNWRKFKEDWINEEEYNKIKEDIKLIEKCSISFLLEKFKERIRILEEVFAIKENMDKIMSKMNKSTLRISIQLSISKLAVVDISDLGSFLKNAKLKGLNSRMRMTIEEVVNKSLAQLSDGFKFDVRICGLKNVAGEKEFEQFEAEIKYTSSDSNAFEFYQCDKHPKSKILQAELEKAMFAELENKFSNITDVNLTELTLGFTFWDTGSLHIMLSLVKKDRSSFNKREIQILNTSFKDMISSKHVFFKEIFGESVQVSADTCPSCTNIETLSGQLEVNIITEKGYDHSDEFVNKIKSSVKMLLAQEINLKNCSEINKNLATMLYSAEQFVNSNSQTSPNVVDIAKIGSIHAFIVETLPWFVLTIDVAQVKDLANPKTGYKDPMKSEIEETKKSENTKESYEMTKLKKSKLKSDWRILWGPLLTEVKINLRSLFHHPASGNFPKDGGKLYKTILELGQNGQLYQLSEYWRRLILPKNGISDSEIFDLYTLCCLLSKSKSMKAHTVHVIKKLCVTMNGMKYYRNFYPYIVSDIVEEIKGFLSTLGFAKESVKEVERLSALLEDVTLSEDELSEEDVTHSEHELLDAKYRRHFVIEEDIDECERLFEAEECLRCLFHDPEYGDFPRNGRKLYEAFIEWNKQGKLNDLEKKYFSTLFPDSKITDSETFGLHLLCYFLCKCTNIKDEGRKIFYEIFELQSQFIRCESIEFDFYQRMDILAKIVWKIKPLPGHYNVFHRDIRNDLYEFARTHSYRRINNARRRLKKKNIVQSKMGYKMDRTDEKKTFEQTEILPK